MSFHVDPRSSGNHAAALALAAKLRGVPAYIVVPNNAPACKLAAVKEYGGEKCVHSSPLMALAHLPQVHCSCSIISALPCHKAAACLQLAVIHVAVTVAVGPARCVSRAVSTYVLRIKIGACSVICAGNLILCEPTMAAREGTAAKIATETGATFVLPYDYGPVIAGQGTIGLELLQQVPQLDIM